MNNGSIMQDIRIESLEESCTLYDGTNMIVVHNPSDIMNIIRELTLLLERSNSTAWNCLPEIVYKRKLKELDIFLSMCKSKVETSEVIKVIKG